jgi:hypothetical protein
MSSNDNGYWHVLIPSRLKPAVERIAEAQDWHPSYIVRKLVERALQQHEIGKKQISVAG